MAEKKEPATQPPAEVKKEETPRPVDVVVKKKLEQAQSDALRAPHNPQRSN